MKELSKIKAPIQVNLDVLKHWKFCVNSIDPFYAYVDGKKTDTQLGIRVECVIIEDNYTADNYKAKANRYEKIRFKLLGETNLGMFAVDEIVVPYGVTKATIYGDFGGTDISVECKLMNADEYQKRVSSKAHA